VPVQSKTVSHVHSESRGIGARMIPICSSLLADIDIVSVGIPRSYRTLCDECRTVVVCMMRLETREGILSINYGGANLGVGENGRR
jgi:hypothetical protein